MPTPTNDIAVNVNRDVNGKLNSDTDIPELRGGDYTNRVNVEFNADGTTFSDTPALGNLQVATLGTQGLQHQRIRIFLDTLFTQVTIFLYNKNLQELGFGFKDVTADMAVNKAAIQDVFNSFAIPASFYNTTADTPYIDVQLALNYSDFSIKITDQDGENIRYTTLVEAISLTGTGTFKEIASKDITGTTFLYATTQDNVLEKYKPVYNVYSVGSAVYVQVINHGLNFYDSIIISNAIGDAVVANGEWVVSPVDANTLLLNAAIAGSLPAIAPAPFTYGGEVYINPYGVGMIGVQEYVPQSDSYTFKKLIASKKFNFVTKKQIDVDGEVNNKGVLLKYTDNYNPPRTFSYNGAYVTDGALSVYNAEGVYQYDSLSDEIKNLINYSSADVNFYEQIQGGGQVPPGNWRYAVRFLTGTLATSELSFLSSPIPTYSPSYSNTVSTDIYGSSVGVLSTPKINRVEVTGITPGRFDFIQLIGYNYAGGVANVPVVVAYNIRREALSAEQTSIILEHNGNEPDITFVDPTDAYLVRPDIIRVGSNRLLDNRLVYGNITTSTSIDIREWVKTFKYSIKRHSLYGSYGEQTQFEFFDPAATTNRVGYQPWEWYRIYVAAEMLSGRVTDAAFCFDVRFVTQTDYDPAEFPENGGDRRDIGNDDYIDYSLGQGVFLYQLYLQLSNVNWEYRIDGVAVKDLFRSIKIMRAERVKEVIVSGNIAMPSPNYKTTVYVVSTGTPTWQFQGSVDNNQVGDSFILSSPLVASQPDVVIDYQVGATIGDLTSPASYLSGTTIQVFEFSSMPNTSSKRKFCSFYAPDIIYGYEAYNHIPGDELLNFGSLKESQTIAFNTGVSTTNPPDLTNMKSWRIWEYENTAVSTPQRVPINNSLYIGTGDNQVVAGTLYVKNFIGSNSYASPVLNLEDYVVNQSSNVDSGLYYGIIFRRKSNKYGDANAIGNTVVYTNASVFNGETSVDVFGGDVFNQQMQFRYFLPEAYDNSSFAFNITSQNIVNVNLRAYDPTSTALAFPVSTDSSTVWLESTIYDSYDKNIGYSIFNNAQSTAVYDPFSIDKGLYPTRKYWSQLSPNNSNVDRYREFLPLDFQDNPNIYGSISHLENINRELFTYQTRGFTREFFNNVGRMQTVENGNVNIGDGSVLSRVGLLMAARGTQHKWSVVKGFTDTGKDVIYWVDADYAAIMRFGSDGSVNLTERTMFSSFVRNAIRFSVGKDSPANNEGIHGVWDNVGRNYIVTCRAWKAELLWTIVTAYSVGDEVKYGEALGVPVIYKCIQDNTGISPESEIAPQYWTAIEFDNKEYYSLWTLVFNERKNAFTHFYTFYPRIYHTQNNRYFSPSPYDGSVSDIFRHRELKGRELNFYGADHIGFTEYIINYAKTVVKKFVAIGSNALLKPVRFEVDTQFIGNNGIDDRTTYMDREGINMRENTAYTTIKNNLNVDGANDQDTAPMRGLWAKVRTFFGAGEKQKINETTVSIRMGQRNVSNP